MRVAIRADASVALGSGHVMRCLTLAQALRRQGAQVLFLCRRLPGHLGEEIRQQGFEVRWLGAGSAPGEQQVHRGRPLDLLVVDHYGLDRRWEKAMRPCARAILVIDDLADRGHACDLLLDQNLLPDLQHRYQGLLPPGCRQLLGPRYALLREDFYRESSRPRLRRDLRRLLVFFGGSDPANLTGRALRELAETALGADVVIGAGNPHRADIQALCDGNQGRWSLHVQTERMAELMAGADLALGAGGSSHWERCVLGLPALVVTVADNQVATTRLLHEQGACWWLGDKDSLPEGSFRQALDTLRRQPEMLIAMSGAARKLVPVDGGTRCVVNAVMERLGAGKPA